MRTARRTDPRPAGPRADKEPAGPRADQEDGRQLRALDQSLAQRLAQRLAQKLVQKQSGGTVLSAQSIWPVISLPGGHMAR